MIAITPTPGVVYKFVFSAEYEEFNGTFKLVKLMTYDEYLEDGGNLLADFFTPCGKNEEDLIRELPNIRDSKIMKLVSPDPMDTETIKFAPVIYLGQTPDHNVTKYFDLGIISHIGITDKPEDLDFVKDNLVEQFEAAMGITPDPKFMSIREQWLTKEEYDNEVAKRDATKKKVINYFSENRRLHALLSSQNTKLSEYEALIKNQHEYIESLQKQLDMLTAPSPEAKHE